MFSVSATAPDQEVGTDSAQGALQPPLLHARARTRLHRSALRNFSEVHGAQGLPLRPSSTAGFSGVGHIRVLCCRHRRLQNFVVIPS